MKNWPGWLLAICLIAASIIICAILLTGDSEPKTTPTPTEAPTQALTVTPAVQPTQAPTETPTPTKPPMFLKLIAYSTHSENDGSNYFDNDIKNGPYPGENIEVLAYIAAPGRSEATLAELKELYPEGLRLMITVRKVSQDGAEALTLFEGPLDLKEEFTRAEWTIPSEYQVGDELRFSAKVLTAGGETAAEDEAVATVDYEVLYQSLELKDFVPFSGGMVSTLDGEASLKITEDIPVLDGATALYPVYAAYAQAVYPKDLDYGLSFTGSPYVRCTNTIGAYNSIIDGSADIIFVAQPSDAQLAKVEAAGTRLTLTPIGYEAFVFVVNELNPLDGLTVEQIKRVYSGEITDWAELGAPELGDIVAYQRNANSGSQTALERLMGDTPIMDPPSDDDYFDDMMGILKASAYRNSANALGFSFRYYVTGMQRANVKLLSLDGVYPSEKNIANGTYPVIATLYAVTTGNESENTKKLIEWVLGEEGQELLKRVGYTPVAAHNP